MTYIKAMIKDSTRMTISTVAAQLVGMVTSILMRRYLTPEMMGIWATFTVILSYAAFSDLGFFAAAEVKIPFLKGKGKADEVQKIRETVFTFALHIALAVIILFWVAAFVFKKQLAPFYFGIRMVAFIIAATLFYNLYVVMLRADKKFQLLANSVLINACITLGCVGVLVYYFRLNGLFVATFLATFTTWLYIKFNTDYRLRINFSLPNAKLLMGTGVPLILVGLLYTLLLSIDKIAIIRMIGAKQLGFYSIAILGFSYTHAFPKLFGIVLFPTMQEEFGKNNSKEQLLGVIEHSSFIMAYLLVFLLALAYFIIPVLVTYILPKYTEGIKSMQLLLLGCFFLSLAPLAQNFIISMGKQIMLIPMLLGAAAIGIVCNFFAIRAGYSIEGVALGTSLAYFAYFIFVYSYSFRHAFGMAYIARLLLKLSLPLISSCLILRAAGLFRKSDSLVITTAVQAGVFLLAYVPLFLYVQKKSGLFTRLGKLFKPVPTEGALHYEA